MSAERKSNLLAVSLMVNVMLIYYSLNLRQEQLTYSITPKLQPVQVDLHSDLAFIERTVKYNKYPTPKDALQDSVTTFFVDHGTYMPAKSKTVQHSVLIGPEICSDKVKLVIGIKTVVTNQDRRKAIRASWGNSTYYTSYPVKFIFLLGRNKNLDADTDLKVLKEEEEHDDILLGDFQDSFHNLTYKDSMLFTWTKHGCPTAEYIFKGDDDTLINPFELQNFLKSENSTVAALYGCVLGGQPVQRSDRTSTGVKYGDELWPEETYPTYVSGGGFLMNRMAMIRVQEMIRITPMIPIDDAFIGICMRRAGLEKNIFRDERFKSWGFKPFEERRFDVCKIEEIVYYHKFTPNEMNCFWPKFITNRERCKEPGYKYEETFPLCNPKDWHKNHQVQPPILDGDNYHHCGPDYGNAGCSVKPTDWVIRQPNNGPCCSSNSYCGITKDHCNCAGCVDFRKVEKEKNQMEAHQAGICCKKLAVQSGQAYSGLYGIVMDKDGVMVKDTNGNVKYEQIGKVEEPFRIEYGGFSVYGIGWYVLAPAGGGLAWQLKDADPCPPVGDWEGYGALVTCKE